ncbi:MAG: hypothetical protein Q8R78_04300 [Candidatus Omnitrophota bacterium]|nr:hypothetical protein [Candidatus Omnitrophota bacterium]
MSTGIPALAEMMRKLKVPAPVERIQHVEWMLTALNRETLGEGRYIVRLACGHTTITKNHMRAKCPDCHALILNGEDYVSFRGLDPDVEPLGKTLK